MEKTPTIKKRNNSVDIIKGICIIFMMIGHVIDSSSFSRHIIYSFHMPVFFIVGGFFLNKINIKNDLKRLILPYIIFGSIGSIAINSNNIFPPLDLTFGGIEWIENITCYLWGICSSLFWGTCGHHHGAPLFNDVPIIAALWFLPAYFVGKNVYLIIKGWVNKKMLGIVCLFMSLAAMIIDNYVAYLPFSINQGISVLIYFYIGNNINIKQLSIWYVVLTLCIWIVGCFLTDLNIAFSYLNKYSILGIIGTIGICWVLYQAAQFINRSKNLAIVYSLFRYIGLNSLYIFCLHYILMIWVCWRFFNHGFYVIYYVTAIVLPVIIYRLYDISKKWFV